ncbi:MAG: SRPBCC family protein [Bacteroidota bacterium]
MLKKILFGLGGVAALLLLGSLALPSKLHVERSIIVNASPDLVFDQVNDLQNLVKWMPYLRIDRTTKLAFGSKVRGQGASYKWESTNPEVGSGTFFVAESTTNERVLTVMDFYDQGKATGYFQFKPANNGVKVTWGADRNLDSSPIAKFKGLMLKSKMGSEMEQGLQNLRTNCEIIASSRETAVNQSGGGDPGDFNIQEVNFPGRSYISVRKTIPMRDVEGHFAYYFQQIYDNCKEQNIRNNGVPSGIFYDWNDANGTVNLAAAIPVKEARNLSTELQATTLPPGKAVMVDYYGDPSGISKAHLAAQQYMQSRGLNAVSPTLEEYYAKPDQQPDPAKWLTRLYFFYQ